MRPRPDPERRLSTGPQFLRYALCGGLAAGTDLLVFFALAWRVFPALLATDPLVRLFGLDVTGVSEALRVRHYVVCRAAAFLLANLVAYVTNARWVFQTGRHGRRKEIALFYGVSLVSLGLGAGLGAGLIRFWGASTTLAYTASLAASILVNFAGRKFWVFRG